MTKYGIIGVRQEENRYFGYVRADNQADAVAKFTEGESEEEIEEYNRYLIFNFDSTTEYSDEEAKGIAKRE